MSNAAQSASHFSGHAVSSWTFAVAVLQYDIPQADRHSADEVNQVERHVAWRCRQDACLQLCIVHDCGAAQYNLFAASGRSS